MLRKRFTKRLPSFGGLFARSVLDRQCLDAKADHAVAGRLRTVLAAHVRDDRAGNHELGILQAIDHSRGQ